MGEAEKKIEITQDPEGHPGDFGLYAKNYGKSLKSFKPLAGMIKFEFFEKGLWL